MTLSSLTSFPSLFTSVGSGRLGGVDLDLEPRGDLGIPPEVEADFEGLRDFLGDGSGEAIVVPWSLYRGLLVLRASSWFCWWSESTIAQAPWDLNRMGMVVSCEVVSSSRGVWIETSSNGRTKAMSNR